MHCFSIALLTVASACQPSATNHVGVGDVVGIDRAGHHVTLRHEAIEGLMPAATTRFDVEAALETEATVGQRVRFVVRQGVRSMVTAITLLDEGNPGVHDHTPHHGGVVSMIGMTHVEARAEPGGRIRLYLTDRFRRPLPLDGVAGTVTLSLADGKRSFAVAVVGDNVEAQVPPLSGREVNADVALRYAGQPLEMTFQLPLAGGGGAAGVPADGCIPPEGAIDAVRPRCVLTFRRPTGALAATPDGTRLLVAGVDIGVSVWDVASKQLLVGFEAAPAVRLAAPEAPHVEVANAVAVRSDGRVAAVALENRVLIYDVESGRLRAAWPNAQGIVRSLAWTPTGDATLLSTFYDPFVRLIGAADGRELRRFAIEREGAAVAFSADGTTLAAGSEGGTIALYDVATTIRTRLLTGPGRATRAMALVASSLVALSDDGILRVWDLATDRPAIDLSASLSSPFASNGSGRVAVAGRDNVIRAYDVARRSQVAELRWHAAPISALAWAGATFASADTDGRVAFWDAP